MPEQGQLTPEELCYLHNEEDQRVVEEAKREQEEIDRLQQDGAVDVPDEVIADLLNNIQHEDDLDEDEMDEEAKSELLGDEDDE